MPGTPLPNRAVPRVASARSRARCMPTFANAMLDDYDPRITAARPDLAARYLEGKVSAARFVDGVEREVLDPQAPVRGEPALDAPLVTEALRGERVRVYEETDEGWFWGQLA